VGIPDLTRDELGFREPAPLWFYILKESEQNLGEDPLSWINVEPTWTPTIPDTDGDEKITMADLLKFAVPEQAGPPVQPPPGGWS